MSPGGRASGRRQRGLAVDSSSTAANGMPSAPATVRARSRRAGVAKLVVHHVAAAHHAGDAHPAADLAERRVPGVVLERQPHLRPPLAQREEPDRGRGLALDRLPDHGGVRRGGGPAADRHDRGVEPAGAGDLDDEPAVPAEVRPLAVEEGGHHEELRGGAGGRRQLGGEGDRVEAPRQHAMNRRVENRPIEDHGREVEPMGARDLGEGVGVRQPPLERLDERPRPPRERDLVDRHRPVAAHHARVPPLLARIGSGALPQRGKGDLDRAGKPIYIFPKATKCAARAPGRARRQEMSPPIRRWVLSLVCTLAVSTAVARPAGQPLADVHPSRPPAGEGEGVATTLEKGYLPELFGDREVTYTRMMTAEGPVALIEGDIIVEPTKVKPVADVVAVRRNLWPGGIVPYEYGPGFGNVMNVRAAMVAMEAATPIRFVPRTTQPGYLLFRDHPVPSQGSSSVGFGGGAQPILIGTALGVVVVLHPLGHAIGLDHEHNSPMRDRFVQVLIANVLDGLKHNFDVASYSVSTVLRPYDFVSIMHYGPTTFGKPIPGTMPPQVLMTMQRKDGAPGPLGGATTMSAHDIAGIEAMYGPLAFMSRASGGFPLSGKTCYTAGPDPNKFPAFQSKTGGAVLCVTSPPGSGATSASGIRGSPACRQAATAAWRSPSPPTPTSAKTSTSCAIPSPRRCSSPGRTAGRCPG